MTENQEKTERKLGKHIVQYSAAYSFCAGCTACEIVCGLTHDGKVGPAMNRIFLERGTSSMVHTIHSCQHCEDHPCYNKCPRKDKAMCIDENGIVYINEAECNGCGLCWKACVYTPSRINWIKTLDKNERKARKCDLCRTRPEGPACVQYCQVSCLGVSTEARPVDPPLPPPPAPPAPPDAPPQM